MFKALAESAVILLVSGMLAGACAAADVRARIDAALQNVTTLVRAGKVGYATAWDGNGYVQCRRMPDRRLRCEAAGATLQPSLRHMLTPERVGRLAALGWVVDPSFGNYVRLFPAEMPTERVARGLIDVLTQIYGARSDRIEVETDWIGDTPCPPRNGSSQNLAGMVNDAPAMQATALLECSYKPDPETPMAAGTSDDIVATMGPQVTAEIQRLRVNSGRRVFAVFDAGIGYAQCMPQTDPDAIYCEAQSAESWPALAALLTPERVQRLRTAGYSDPGRSPNYWKIYPFDAFTDAAIADELLRILFDVYGYRGAVALAIKTEARS